MKTNKQTELIPKIPPMLSELELHGEKIGLPRDEVWKFHAYYSANGWKVGRNAMKSWPNALVHWKLQWEQRQSNHVMVPLHIRLKAVDELLAKHPANPDSTFHTGGSREIADYKALKAKRESLLKQIASL